MCFCVCMLAGILQSYVVAAPSPTVFVSQQYHSLLFFFLCAESSEEEDED